jgi:hypothetical protein
MRTQDNTVVVVSRQTGLPVAEISAARGKKVDSLRFEVLTPHAWLSRFNRLVREAGGVQPSAEAFLSAVKT